MKKIYIVGGGSSLRAFNFSRLRDKETIAVNKSIFHVPDPNYFITTDYTFMRKITRNLILFRKDKATKIFVVNYDNKYIKDVGGKIVDTRFRLTYDLSEFDVIIKSRKNGGIGFSFKDFRCGASSGYCALQFAVIMGYKEIYLLGIDLTTTSRTHFHEGYGESRIFFQNRLNLYYQYFVEGIKYLKKNTDIKVYSCSKISRLNSFIPYVEL